MCDSIHEQHWGTWKAPVEGDAPKSTNNIAIWTSGNKVGVVEVHDVVAPPVHLHVRR